LVVIAPAPRRHEDLQGRALAGGPRNVLDAAIIEAGLDPGEVRVTSVVRCRPPDDRAPSMAEIRACAPHLEAELELLAPEVVVTLGALATSVLLGRPVPFERVVGFRLDVRSGTTLIPTHHPLDALRGDKRATNGLRRDLGVAAAVLDGRMKSGAAARDELRARLR
jgi:uracil-DNA glycosylase